MGKRKKDATYYKRKIRRMERKMKELSQEPNDSSDSVSTPCSPPIQQAPTPSENNEESSTNPTNEIEIISPEDEHLPEEFLLALGKEGEEKEEIGEPIRPELALRWIKIMSEGLGKEARITIMNKYPTPSNFPNDMAPKMNPEIMATLTEPSVKRDKRIVIRQNLTGKLMTCLGRSLTNILKGNINSKLLIEQINDAAKIAADIHHDDSSSRKFFALSGAQKSVQEAMKNTRSDNFLFGADCAEKIKTAQSIQKTSAQIADKSKKKQVITTRKQSNWRGPLLNQQPQHQQVRGGPRQQHFLKS